MTKAPWLNPLQSVLLCLVAFTIPFPFVVNSYCIVLLTLTWLLHADLKDTFRRLLKNRTALAWVVFYLLHAVSYSYSDNKVQSLFDLQIKLSFIVFPVILSGMDITPARWRGILLSFITAVSLAALFYISRAAFLHAHGHGTDVFFYHRLVAGSDSNAVYMSWYVLLSAGMLLFTGSLPGSITVKPALRIVLLLVHILFLILLSSKMMLGVFLFLVFPLYLFTMDNFRRKRLRVAAGIIAVVFCVTALSLTDNPVRERFRDMSDRSIATAFRKDYSDAYPLFSNFSTRLYIWRLAWELIARDRLWMTGSGNGDQQLLLNRAMVQTGITKHFATKEAMPLYNVNLHNMYLQSLFMLGIPGLAVFLYLLIAPFLPFLHRTDRQPFQIFYAAAFVVMLFESALQTQAGIVLYCFFSLLFLKNHRRVGTKGR